MKDETKEWLGRAALITVALASVATSGKKYKLNAEIPALAASDTHAQRVVIRASQHPEVRHVYKPSGGGSPKREPSSGNERYSFLVPPGATVSEVSISGSCGDPLIGCNNDCPGPHTYVKVESIDLVPVWTQTLNGPPIKIELTEKYAELELQVVGVELATLRAVVEGDPAATTPIGIDGATDYAKAVDGGPPTNRVYTLTVHRAQNAPEGPLTATYVPVMQAYGLCEEGQSSCAPPPSSKPEFVSVKVLPSKLNQLKSVPSG